MLDEELIRNGYMAVPNCDGNPDCNGFFEGDLDNDGDVDGFDLEKSSSDYGRTDCPAF